MSNQKRKVRSWFISVIMLISLLCAGYAVAKDKDQPQTPPETGKGQGKDKAQPHVGSIFDDQADEFEEPTYTPPADIEAKIKAIPPIPSNIMQYLKEKYKMKGSDFVSARLQQTPNGPAGSITISGHTGEMRPKADIPEGSKEDRARAIAKAFVEEEVSLFGVIKIEELKESKVYIDEIGHIHVRYHRHIGDLPVDNLEIHIEMVSDENITWVTANAVPISPDVYQAAAKKTLGRGKIFRIIRQELKAATGGNDVGMGVTKAYKVAIPKPPYVIWKVSVSTVDNAWDYRIDAFTGEIIVKQSAMTPLVRPTR